MRSISTLRLPALALALVLPLLAPAQNRQVRYAFAGAATDLSGHSRAGSLIGGAAIANGQVITGDNATDYLSIPNTALNGAHDFSVALTVRIDTRHGGLTGNTGNPFNTVISAASSAEEINDNNFVISCYPRFNNWRVYVNNNPFSFNTGANSTLAGVWYHVAFVRQGSRGHFYFNGQEVGTGYDVGTDPIPVDPGGLMIGQDQDVLAGGFQAQQSLAGRVGELTIYDGALDAEQIAELAKPTWSGDVSPAWSAAENWNLFRVPGATDPVIVPAEAANQPVISTSAAVRDLTLEAGTMLQLASGATLDLKGNLTNRSAVTSLLGTTTFSGAAPQQVLGDAVTTFGNLTVGSAGVADGSNGLRVERLLTLNGNLTVGATPLVLRSTAAATALVVNSGGVVNGRVAVQRFINAGPNAGMGYRHLASPVTNAPIRDLNTTTFAAVVNPVYNLSNQVAAVRPYPNVLNFDESRVTTDFVRGYVSPGSAFSPMVPTRGYSVYMPASTSAATTPDFVGTLNDGNISAEPLTNTSGLPDAGWHLLGNPYAAPLDWNKVRALPGAIPAGMADAVSVYQSTGRETGTYLTYANGIGNLPGGLIAMGQAFFVRNTVAGTAPAFTFTNAMRATTYANPTMHRLGPTDARPLLALAVTNLADGVRDEAFVYAEAGATAGFDARFDAPKVGRSLVTAPTLSLPTGPQELAINGLPVSALTAHAVLPLRVLVNVAGPHTLAATQVRNLPAGEPLWLTDGLTGTTVDLTKLPAGYSFQQAPDFAGARFTLQLGGARPVREELASALTLEAYPNPLAGGTSLTLHLRGLAPAARTVQATLCDRMGRVVRHQTWAAEAGAVQQQLPTNGLPTGPYSLRLRVTETGEAVSRTVVVQ